MEVKEDFFMYKGGVYRYSLPANILPPNHRKTGFHSVRIIGSVFPQFIFLSVYFSNVYYQIGGMYCCECPSRNVLQQSVFWDWIQSCAATSGWGCAQWGLGLIVTSKPK